MRRYAPIANPEEIELESLNTMPALLDAMDTERRAWQRSGDPREKAYYEQIRLIAESNLASLNTPLLLASPEESRRRALARKWIADIGNVTIGKPMLHPPEIDTAPGSQSQEILTEMNQLTDQVRAEVKATLTGLQTQEARSKRTGWST